MPELKTYTTPITTYDSFVDRAARDFIGDIDRLDTADKSNLVNAINELIHFGNFVISVTGDVDSGYEIDKTGAEITTAIEKKVPIFLFALTDSVSAVLPVSSIEDGEIHFSGVLEKDDKTWQNNVSILYSDDSASVDYVSLTNIASKNEVDFALQEAERAQEMASEKVDKSGWSADKYLGTDSDGNVVEKDAPSGGLAEVSWEDIQDKPFYTEGGVEEVFPEQTVEGFSAMEVQGMSFFIAQASAPYALVKDTTYKIKWDEIEYELTAFEAQSSSGGTLVGVGNQVLAGGAVDETPFGIVYDPTDSVSEYFSFLPGESHKVGIYIDSEVVHQLDAKYLPMDAIDARIGAYLDEALGGDY